MKLYCDASVLAAMALSEPSADRIVSLLSTTARVAYGDFGFGETCSSIAIAVRRDRRDAAEHDTLVADIRAALIAWHHVTITSADIVDATAIVQRYTLGLRLPDAIHVAVARRLDMTLLTLDRQQALAAAALNVAIIDPIH